MAYNGTKLGQDSRFKNPDTEILSSMKIPKIYKTTIKKENLIILPIIKLWINKKLSDILEFEDETLTNLIINLIKSSKEKIEPKNIQYQISGFLGNNTYTFMKDLWKLLINVQELYIKDKNSIPEELIPFQEEYNKRKQFYQSNKRKFIKDYDDINSNLNFNEKEINYEDKNKENNRRYKYDKDDDKDDYNLKYKKDNYEEKEKYDKYDKYYKRSKERSQSLKIKNVKDNYRNNYRNSHRKYSDSRSRRSRSRRSRSRSRRNRSRSRTRRSRGRSRSRRNKYRIRSRSKSRSRSRSRSRDRNRSRNRSRNNKRSDKHYYRYNEDYKYKRSKERRRDYTDDNVSYYSNRSYKSRNHRKSKYENLPNKDLSLHSESSSETLKIEQKSLLSDSISSEIKK